MCNELIVPAGFIKFLDIFDILLDIKLKYSESKLNDMFCADNKNIGIICRILSVFSPSFVLLNNP